MRYAIFGLLALSGCAGAVKPVTVTQTIYVPFKPPAYLITCPDDPAPGTWARESDVASYIVSLKAASDDCRNVLAALVAAAALNASAK